MIPGDQGGGGYQYQLVNMLKRGLPKSTAAGGWPVRAWVRGVENVGGMQLSGGESRSFPFGYAQVQDDKVGGMCLVQALDL